jgi:hypothetical protein
MRRTGRRRGSCADHESCCGDRGGGEGDGGAGGASGSAHDDLLGVRSAVAWGAATAGMLKDA